MYKKINFYLRFSALFSMLLSTAFILIACCSLFNSRLNTEIGNEAGVIASVLNHNENYNKILNDMQPEFKDKQVLLLAPDNSVLYSFNVSEKNLNAVLKKQSKTALNEKKYENLGAFVYVCSTPLENGSVLYILSPFKSKWTVFLTFGVPIAVMVLLIYLLSVSISMRITESIIKPIEKSYSFNRENYDDIYDEIQPFLKRIARQNKEIRKNMEKLKRAEKIRSEFSANVSHELKTPLTSIKGFSQIIANGIAKEEDIPKFARKIEKESSRLIILIDDIIKLSDLDENDFNIPKSRINLKEAAAQICDRLVPLAEERGITLELEGEGAEVYANMNRIDELIYNLTDNAIKYNRENGSVIIRTGKDGEGKSFISIKDTGIGIPEKYLDRIFERFFRVDKSHSKLINGTGLGLSIVKHIALASNADIRVESEINKGTVFTVTFN